MRLATFNLLSMRDVDNFEITGVVQSIDGSALSDAGIDTGSFNPWVRRWARCCPRCLALRQIWLIGWEVLFADACPQCGRWLVDSCSQCGVQIPWTRHRLQFCDCGQSLTGEQACHAPESVVRLSRALHCKAMGLEPTDIQLFNGMSLGQCVRLVRLLGTYGASDGCGAPQKVLHIDALQVSWPVTSMAAEILCTWPMGLTRLLENLRGRERNEGKGKLTRAFGGFYAALYKGFKDVEFDFLRTAFETYVAEHWTGAIAKRNRRLGETVLSSMAWIPANHACRALSVSRRRLVDLIQEGRLRGETRLSSTNRRFIVVLRADVENLVANFDDGIPLIEAATRLGLTKQRLLALLPIICPTARKLGEQGCPWSIPVIWVERWETLIRSQLPVEATDSTTVALDHLLRYWPWTDKQIGNLLVDIFSGAIAPAGAIKTAGGVGTLVLHVNQLNQWFSSKQGMPYDEMTLPDVALRIGVKQEVVYALVRVGLLHASLRKSGRRTEQRVKRSVLDDFEHRYIFGRDVARVLGRSPRATAAFLVTEGVLPVAGPGIDTCRQTVFERDKATACLDRNGLKKLVLATDQHRSDVSVPSSKHPSLDATTTTAVGIVRTAPTTRGQCR